MIDPKTIMGFMYSKEDLAIDWEEAERWAKKMEGKGYGVEKRLMKGAEHLQLFLGKRKRGEGMGVGVGLG